MTKNYRNFVTVEDEVLEATAGGVRHPESRGNKSLHTVNSEAGLDVP